MNKNWLGHYSPAFFLPPYASPIGKSALLSQAAPIAALLFGVIGCGGEIAAANTNVTIAKLVSITDLDVDGQVETIRTEVNHNEMGQRIANKVVDSLERLVATEKLKYDGNGRLVERQHLINGGAIKWKWINVKHDDNGLPIRNDIVNAKGKNIGWYKWDYKDGRLVRRSRFNRDGSLRFYYADMKFDAQGNYSEWTKYDRQTRIIGTKKWTFAKP